MERGGLPPAELKRAHDGLSLAHRLLGNHAAILRALRADSQRVGRVLDIGCGHGELLRKVRRRLGADVVGVDLQPPLDSEACGVPIVKGNAVTDDLPGADVAVSVCMAHHLTDGELVGMIRNVGRSCRRFVLLDLVRHRLPLTLFRSFSPLCLPRVNVLDGSQSIRRAWTPVEFRALVGNALTGTRGTFRHTVAPGWIRQIADIRYSG